MTTINITPRELAATAINLFGALQDLGEFASLVTLASDEDCKHILEIGAGNGGTSWAWSRFATTVVSVDLPNGPWGGKDISAVVAYISQTSKCTFTYVPGNSHHNDVFCKAKALVTPTKGVDLLFIDGDHSYEGVKEDYLTYAPLVRPGGLVAFHDIVQHAPESGCEVKRFWDEIKAKFTHLEFITNASQGYGGIGVIRMHPEGDA